MISESSLKDFLEEHWLYDNTGDLQDMGFLDALQRLADWFDIDYPKED